MLLRGVGRGRITRTVSGSARVAESRTWPDACQIGVHSKNKCLSCRHTDIRTNAKRRCPAQPNTDTHGHRYTWAQIHLDTSRQSADRHTWTHIHMGADETSEGTHVTCTTCPRRSSLDSLCSALKLAPRPARGHAPPSGVGFGLRRQKRRPSHEIQTWLNSGKEAGDELVVGLREDPRRRHREVVGARGHRQVLHDVGGATVQDLGLMPGLLREQLLEGGPSQSKGSAMTLNTSMSSPNFSRST